MSTILYLGTDEGVRTLQSEDGESWEVTAGKMPPWSVEEVAVSTERPNLVFAGTRADGVWVSEDFGKTFTKPSRGNRGPGKVRCVTLDPSNPTRVYAGCEPIDVFVSDDLGKTWSVIESLREHPWVSTIDYPVATVEPHVRDIAIDPNDSDTIYVALQVGAILKTTDGCKTWSVLKDGLDTDVHTISIDPNDSDHLVIATGGHDSRLGTTGGKALFTSNDAGESWSAVAMNFYQEYSVPLTAMPGRPEILYSALANNNPGQWRNRDTGAEGILVRSTDGGQNWAAVDAGKIEGFDRVFTTAIAGDTAVPDRVYGVLTNGELIGSENGGDSWSLLGVNQPGTNDMKAVSA